jgi:VIT1/CCC1 family predicted Fe2+/Mn2+ transporter
LNKTFKFLLLAYIPGVFLPVVHYLLGSSIWVTWYYMIAWIVYVFIILALYYVVEEASKNV